MSAATTVADAARTLVGARFRLHGRDPASGLDCIGVVAHALAAGGWPGTAPSGYALRGGDPARIAARLDAAMLTPASGERPGDVLLAAVGGGQLHLMVRTPAGFVHADAALRRVVERPGDPPWPVLGAWRWDGRSDGRGEGE